MGHPPLRRQCSSFFCLIAIEIAEGYLPGASVAKGVDVFRTSQGGFVHKNLFPRRFRALGRPRRSPGSRPVGFDRKLAIELLEPRRLLSLTNVDLSPTQKNAITSGLAGLADWATTLDRHGIARQVLPVIGRSVGDALGIGDILGQGLSQPIVDFLLADTGQTSTGELVAALEALLGTSFDNVLINVANVTGGLNTDPGTNELLFNFEFDADRSLIGQCQFRAHWGCAGHCPHFTG